MGSNDSCSVVVPVARPPAARRGRGRQRYRGSSASSTSRAPRPLMVGKYRTQDTDEYKDSPFAPDRRGEAVTGPFPLQEMREHNARVRASLAA